MMKVVKFTAAKGGQGVTVTAAAFAVAKARQGVKVRLVPSSDTWAALGLPDGATEAQANLIVGRDDANAWMASDLVVIDGGTDLGTLQPDHTFLVTRLCFLALHRAMTDKIMDAVDEVIVIREPGRSLTRQDVEDCLGKPVALELECDAAVARTVDAGLLACREPKCLRALGDI